MRKRRFRHLLANRKGVAALEFALVAPPLLMLTFGTIEFGRAIWAKQALQLTAAQGARCMGVLAPSCATGTTYSQANTVSYIQSVASGWGLTIPTGGVTVVNGPSNAGSAECPSMSEVTLTYTFQTAVPGLLQVLSGGEAFTGRACFPNWQ